MPISPYDTFSDGGLFINGFVGPVRIHRNEYDTTESTFANNRVNKDISPRVPAVWYPIKMTLFFTYARSDTMGFDKKYLVWAMGYAVIGICLGIFMAASHNFAEREAHSHVLLIGFVLSFGYGIIHRLWLEEPKPMIAKIQFISHQAGAATMSIGLFLLYGNISPAATLDPILGLSSIFVLAGALLMFFMLLKSNAVKA